jgi:hypothetical protein
MLVGKEAPLAPTFNFENDVIFNTYYNSVGMVTPTTFAPVDGNKVLKVDGIATFDWGVVFNEVPSLPAGTQVIYYMYVPTGASPDFAPKSFKDWATLKGSYTVTDESGAVIKQTTLPATNDDIWFHVPDASRGQWLKVTITYDVALATAVGWPENGLLLQCGGTKDADGALFYIDNMTIKQADGTLVSLLDGVKAPISVTNSDTGIIVSDVPFGTQLTVAPLTEGDAFNTLSDALTAKLNGTFTLNGFVSYDITIKNFLGEAATLTDTATVKVPVPEGFTADNGKVFRTEADGSLTELQFTIADGLVVFTTDHFSNYALANVTAIDNGGNGDGDGDGDPTVPPVNTFDGGALVSLLMMGAAAIPVVIKKRS